MSQHQTQPLDHPAVWRGGELLARRDWRLRFSEDDRRELLALRDSGDGADAAELPSLGPKLARVQHDLEHGSGACLIEGWPVEEFSAEQAMRAFEAFTRGIGTPVSQSADGRRVFSVRDEGYKLDDKRARGPNTKKRLSFHTDRCDVIAFLCLKQAKSGGDNQIVSSMALYNEMLASRPDLLGVLMQPFYYQRHNVDTGNERPWCRQPIFSFREGHFAASYLRVLIDRAYASPELPDMTPQEREALDFLEELAADPALHVRFRQQPGDVLLLNNWVTLHRRDEFEDHEDLAERRHLLRVWLAAPNSRPIDPLFADNFGATDAGAVRGGMRASSDRS